MIGNVIILRRRVVRSIVVEQLNDVQWHAFHSHDCGIVAGAVPLIEALGLSFGWRQLTGLPVVIAALPQRSTIGGAA